MALPNAEPIHGEIDPQLGVPLSLEIAGRPRRIVSRLEYFNVHDGTAGPVLACAWLVELSGGERWWVYRDPGAVGDLAGGAANGG
jgi:hypothetical protein